MSTTSRRATIAAALLTLALGACGDATGTADDADTSASSTGESEPPGDETAGSPLEQLFGSMGDNQRFVEDEVATCMRDRGWEYEPNTAGTRSVAFGGPGGLAGDGEFLEQYGYGISTRPPMDALPGVATSDRGDDPNADYVDALSETDRERYFTDLTGLPPFEATGDAAGGARVFDAGDIDPNSCFSQAQQAAAAEHPELGEEFGRRLGELLQGIDDDPAMVEAMAAWSACITEAGYPFESQREIIADLSQRYSQITGQEQPGDGDGEGDDGEGGLIIVGGLDGEELDLSPADEERLGRLQAEEVAIARADARCATEHLDGVRAQLEQEVADVLRSEYPGLGAAA